LARKTQHTLNQPASGTRHVGHPIWHLVFPDYHRFKRRQPIIRHEEGAVQNYWKDASLYRRRSYVGIEQAYKRLAERAPYRLYIEKLKPWFSNRVFNIGCGNGTYLRSFIEAGIPFEKLYGCDLHEVRIVSCRRLCLEGAVQAKIKSRDEFDDLSLMKEAQERFFVHDVLDEAGFPEQVIGMELVLVTGVAPSLDDEQLKYAGMKISEIIPIYICDISNYENELHNIGGRKVLDPYFPGYETIEQEFIYDPFRLEALRFLWEPRNSWPAMLMTVMRRRQ